MRLTFAYVDLAALAHNLSLAGACAPGGRLFAVIKADAYGHGAVQCAAALTEAYGFAVATVEEAIELREAGVKKPLLILSAFCEKSEVELLHQFDLMPVIHHGSQIRLLEEQATGRITCWVKFDSGMNRLGFKGRQCEQAVRRLQANPHIRIAAAMTHFAASEELDQDLTKRQIQRFKTLTQICQLPLSMANSAAILACPESHADFNRPGIMLYGSSPLPASAGQKHPLKAVMCFQSRIIAVKDICAGEGIGYGHIFMADKTMRIGIVACGYADGYPRHAPGGTPVLVDGKRSRILGRISMDSLAVDLTELPEAGVGSIIILWGADLPVNEIARASATISYELLSGVSKRVPRIHQ